VHPAGVAAVEHEHPQVDDDRVVGWRFEVLRRAGYDAVDAFQLAAAREIDIRLAERLLAEGCPAETAVRILV